ncbi:T9SS type A sorting domain-containing protein [candidate division KSB1 bacterium]|nr:T9SS type A sorting domain-containing protein [candidate division KSB1 bacterium]
MKKRYNLLLSIMLVFLLISQFAFASVITEKTLAPERAYEHVVIFGNDVGKFAGTPIDQLRMYAYHKNSGWEPVPFQVDENDTTGNGQFQNGILDSLIKEEIVLLAQDLGDKVSVGEWINDSEARTHERYEFDFIDRTSDDSLAVRGSVYLFISSSAPKSDRTYINYDAEHDVVNGEFYTMNFGERWYPENISIPTTYGGNGNDFFERTKFRLHLMVGGISPLILDETSFIKTDNINYNQNAVVRLTRRIYLQAFLYGTAYEDPFPFTYTHYPYATILSGKLPNMDIFNAAPLKTVRFSYDLESNVTSQNVKFYSGDSTGLRNNGIAVDGQVDAGVMTQLQNNRDFWTLVTAQPNGFGSMLTIDNMRFIPDEDMIDEFTQNLYYWDATTDDSSTYNDFDYDFDTGDYKSYGDHGLFFKSYKFSGSFRYKTVSFYLPANQTAATAETMFHNSHNSLYYREEAQGYAIGIEPTVTGTVPKGIKFAPNYPNPFNPSTTLTFTLPSKIQARLVIYDLNGRNVNTLTDGKLAAGDYKFQWNGQDANGQTVGSGIYFAVLETPDFRASHKLVLAK